MAGKILFPIPNRRLSKRLYRLTRRDPASLWGARDRLIPPAYAERWQALIPQRARRDGRRRRPHAALRAAGGVRPRADRASWAEVSEVTLVSFDIDGTLEIGDPPGIITIDAVRAARALGYLVGTCSDRPVAHQRQLWQPGST